ncbi:MAG: DEAD/DEAH box helicase [Caldilineaceae bacterium]
MQVSAGQLRAQLHSAFPALKDQALKLTSTTVWLPTRNGAPLTHGQNQRHKMTGRHSTATRQPATHLVEWQVTGVTVSPFAALRFLTHLNTQMGEFFSTDTLLTSMRLGNDLLFWSNAAKYALQLLAAQQFLPTLRPQNSNHLLAGWQPLLAEPQDRAFEQLIATMPPLCRAYTLTTPADAPTAAELLSGFVATMLDAAIRQWGSGLATDSPTPSRQWFARLVTPQPYLELPPQDAFHFYQTWRTWSEQLHVIRDANFRICFRLDAPSSEDGVHTAVNGVAGSADLWNLRYFLQARDHLNLMVAATDVWEQQNHSLQLGSRLLDQPQERLLAGLTVAARISPPIQRSLRSPRPDGAHLTTEEAYQFLHETATLLESSGFGIILPEWWRANQWTRLGLRLRLMSDDDEFSDEFAVAAQSNGAPLRQPGKFAGQVRYDWELVLGNRTLSRVEFEQLAALQSPLVRLEDEWVELDPEQVQLAQRFLREQSASGVISFLRALRIAQTYLPQDAVTTPGAEPHYSEQNHEERNALLAELLSDQIPATLPINGVDVSGWLATTLGRLSRQQDFAPLPKPEHFIGELRPYQHRGAGWLDYLRNLGLGACLADDMGLGKTIQSIALLLAIRERSNTPPPAALLLCPTSVVANWRREVERFAPTLRTLVHHGSGRLSGDLFYANLPDYDLVITSYGTARRDVELLSQFTWSDLILDEAQNIKNPSAKQTQAVRRLQSQNRIALTGTPVENRLAELWSIMEFLNPGYLENYERFRRRYIIPVERYNDDTQVHALRQLVQPFLLRRLKSDPTIIADLPEKNEMVVFCSLTKEQADLYARVVDTALTDLDQSQGLQRRGMVLALLTKLKQICNHPAHYLKEEGPLAGRSGKLSRLTEMMEEVLAVGDSALVFTQFVEMGELLQKHLSETFKVDVLFLHGRTSAAQRERMVVAFQEAETPTIFILSLRAGGAGLNLTRANHVFHFDRWWNPAVENQATDRAFRIGQRRDVQVHKYVVAGTLEEHIHQILEDKRSLAETVVGSGEQWLTELSTDQLRDLLLLRTDLASDE